MLLESRRHPDPRNSRLNSKEEFPGSGKRTRCNGKNGCRYAVNGKVGCKYVVTGKVGFKYVVTSNVGCKYVVTSKVRSPLGGRLATPLVDRYFHYYFLHFFLTIFSSPLRPFLIEGVLGSKHLFSKS